MTGYAAFGRVERGRVGATPPAPPLADRADPVLVVADRVDAGRPALEARVRERLALAREQWAMTTFYLFDPDSWR